MEPFPREMDTGGEVIDVLGVEVEDRNGESKARQMGRAAVRWLQANG